MKKALTVALLTASTVFAAEEQMPQNAPKPKPEGWSLDVGGTYTWMHFTTPPTYRGSTGGVQGKLTHQRPNYVFGQVRTFYNAGKLSSSLNKARDYEWYSEFVAGYSFKVLDNWTITPYAGMGLDFLHDNHTGYSTVAPIQLRYNLYYALIGFDAHYTWTNWMAGVQADCLPMFNQYLKIEGLPGAAWTLGNRTGAAARLPIAYRYAKNFWLELAPYYRFLPLGASGTLGLPERNLNQWGVFLTFRFFL